MLSFDTMAGEAMVVVYSMRLLVFSPHGPQAHKHSILVSMGMRESLADYASSTRPAHAQYNVTSSSFRLGSHLCPLEASFADTVKKTEKK